MQVKG